MKGEQPDAGTWLAQDADKVIETSCAWVFLKGETAWKMKRPVDFGFLDFTTLEKRGWALAREQDFNVATAPDIYRGVHQITRKAGGGFELDGWGETVEHVLEMRRFDDQAVLSAQPQVIDAALAETLGRTIARYHAQAPLRREAGAASLMYVLGSNAKVLRGLSGVLGQDAVEALIAATDAAFTAQEPLLEQRAATGFTRRCHGDLHLGNVFLEDGAPVIFDCIEFNDLLSEIDVQYDLAFILMDLDFRGRRDAAVRLLSAYLDEAARTFGDGVFEGLAALPLMMSIRAAVRAHVTAHADDAEAARGYLAAARAHLQPPPAQLIALGGLSGTGKSTLARIVAPDLGAAPGALILRTDEIRKRLLGAAPTESLPGEAYAPDLYDQVYDALFATARAAVRAGRSVILDATFLQPPLRQRARDLAGDLGVPFVGRWLDAPADVLRARVAARSGDASDATVATLDKQLAHLEKPADWTIIDASGAPESAAGQLNLT